MAVPTVLIGLLPGYDTLGVAAPILLTLLRMLQGLAVGGEAAIAGVFLVESAPPGRRGLVGALGGFGNGLGVQLGSVTAAVCATLMPPEDLAAWGWRIPFLLGFLVGIAGFLLRRNLREAAAAAPPKSPTSPVIEVVRHHVPLVLRIAGLVAFNAIAFNLAFLYIVHWLQEVDGVAPARALQINSISMLAIMPVSLFTGWLSDHIGRRGILLTAATIAIVGAVPFFALMHSASTLMIMLGQFGFVIAVGLAFGVMPALTTETTPLGVRCTALALGNNTSYSIMGGLMPLAATWLVYRTGNDYSPAYLIMVAAALTFIAALCHPESYRSDFKTLASKPA